MDFVPFTEAAEILNVSRPTITKWIKEGKLVPDRNVGKIRTVTKASIDKLLQDETFQLGLKVAQKNKSSRVQGQENLSNVAQQDIYNRLSNLEKTVVNIVDKLTILHKIVQDLIDKKVNLGNNAQNNIDPHGG